MEGFVSITGFVDGFGHKVSNQKAVDYGWVKPFKGSTSGWDIDSRVEIPLGKNLFVNGGRQMVCYAMGFRSPISNYVIQSFSVGTGTLAPKVTDTSLVNPIILSNDLTYKAIDGVDFPSPFISRTTFTLGISDANGYLITEMGLLSGDGTLIARKSLSGINKSSDWSPSLSWRTRW